MSRDRPYIVRPWVGDKAADVVDRRSGERVGFVLADFYGRWEGRLVPRDGRSASVVGGKRKYRSEAVGAVWAAHAEGAG